MRNEPIRKHYDESGKKYYTGDEVPKSSTGYQRTEALRQHRIKKKAMRAQRVPLFDKPKGAPGRKIVGYKTIRHAA